MNRFFGKSILVTTALLSLFALLSISSTAHAQNIEMPSDIDAEAVDRFSESDVIRLITNRDESVNLIVAETGIAIQFSEQFMDNLDDEINSADGDGDNSVLAKTIKSMVSSGVRTILDHAILIPFYEIGSISYEDGRIIITDMNGEELFEDLEVNDKQVMEDFSRRDSRRFVADAEKLLI